jgi:hypothetical protein
VVLVVAGFTGFVVAFCLVLFTVYRMRPESFRFKATLTKWISLDMEMRSPQALARRPRRPRRSGRRLRK